MARSQNIDAILNSWAYEPGEVSARMIRGSDGRQVLQMRVDLGVLQLETEHRPDGARPSGAETYFDYLLGLVVHDGDPLTLDDEQCAEVDREFVQFYQRRLCWLALREFRRAVADADHSLALMDFVRNCSPSEGWTQSHEQYRPFILFHRTQAIALAILQESGPEAAIEEINRGVDRMRQALVELAPDEAPDEDEMVRRLNDLRQSLRDHYHVGRTLNEQLAEAVANEQYEQAARLRDEIAKRGPPDVPKR
ncbi:MAG: UvrB/UvrC motif-containing protein [Planctomycetes bacterium]|nr:UvrB/UvrC motif-containing protein [Planctomycetota bacterium]